MIRNPREKELPTKQEGSIANDRASTSSRLWSGLRNPRIIRVSRAFGGKDRHSKVTTIRGLRDRRVRLSVPTAIQLYDLQERLGVNQPSKVVDWLLNAAQHEIDKLPPLPMLPGNFIQFSQSLAKPQEVTPPQSPSLPHADKNTGYRTLPKSTYWNADAPQRAIQRGTQRELGTEKGNEVENGIHSAQAQAHDPLLRMSHSSLSGLLSNSMPYNSYYHLEPANAHASHMGIHSSQLELAPTFQMPGSQLVFCPSGANPSMFQPYMTASTEFDARQISQLQMVSSTMSEFYSNLASKHQHES